MDQNYPDPNDQDQNDRDRNVPDPNDRDRNVPDPNDRDQNDLDPFPVRQPMIIIIKANTFEEFFSRNKL